MENIKVFHPICMKKKYTLKIADPCQENWQKMKPNEAGKFCNLCSKNVIDFSHLSDNEVIRLIEKSNGNLCGRLNQNQLNRPLIETKSTPVNTRFHQVLAGLLLISNQNGLNAQSNNQKNIKIENSFETKIDTSTNFKSYIEKTIGGIITDSITNEPIIFADISIENTILKTTSDINGNFQFDLSKNLASDTIIMKVKSYGYKEKTFMLSNLTLNHDEINIQLIEDINEIEMEGMVIIQKPKKWWQFWKRK